MSKAIYVSWKGSNECRRSKTLIGDGNITLDLAKNVLKQLIADTQLRPVTIDLIIESVCDRYNVSQDDLLSKKRSKQIISKANSNVCVQKIVGYFFG